MPTRATAAAWRPGSQQLWVTQAARLIQRREQGLTGSGTHQSRGWSKRASRATTRHSCNATCGTASLAAKAGMRSRSVCFSASETPLRECAGTGQTTKTPVFAGLQPRTCCPCGVSNAGSPRSSGTGWPAGGRSRPQSHGQPPRPGEGREAAVSAVLCTASHARGYKKRCADAHECVTHRQGGAEPRLRLPRQQLGFRRALHCRVCGQAGAEMFVDSMRLGCHRLICAWWQCAPRRAQALLSASVAASHSRPSPGVWISDGQRDTRREQLVVR